MFSSLVTRIIPTRARMSRASMEFHARKAQRDAERNALADKVERYTRSEATANEQLSEAARRQADKARTIAARGHSLYKATARALVNGSDE